MTVVLLIVNLVLVLLSFALLRVAEVARKEARRMLRESDDIRDEVRDLQIQAQARVKDAQRIWARIEAAKWW